MEPAQAELLNGREADPLRCRGDDPSFNLNAAACSALAWIVTMRSNDRDPHALDTCRRLLRAQTLHALAGRLAELTSHLRRHAGPSAPAPLPEWVVRQFLAPAAVLLRSISGFVITLLRFSDAASKAADSGPQKADPGAAVEASGAAGASSGPGASGGRGGVKDEGAGGSRGPAAGLEGPAEAGPAAQAGAQAGAEAKAAAQRAGAERCFVQELSRALRESCALEHCSATLLALLEAWGRTREAAALLKPGAEPQPEADTLFLVAEASAEFTNLQDALLQQTPAAVPAPGLPLGPCSSYAVLAHGLAVLACLDGGPTHGLREELAPALIAQAFPCLEWMRLEGCRVAAVPPDVTAVEIRPAARAIHNLLALLDHVVSAPNPASAKASPAGSTERAHVPGSRALLRPPDVARLAARVARLALTALASQTEAQEEEGSGGPDGRVRLAVLAGGRCRVLVRRDWVEEAAILALQTGPRIASAAGGGPSAPPLLDAAWWRLVAEAALHVRSAVMAETLGRKLLSQLPGLPLSNEPLPPSPPPALAAALEGGVLPCLERLFRRAASDSGGREKATIVAFLDHVRHASFTWLLGPLAYGDVRQAAALVRTIGKALGCVGSLGLEGLAVLVAGAAEFLQSGRGCLESLAARRSARSGAGGGSGGGGGALTAPERQLVGMLAAAVASWLPSFNSDDAGFEEEVCPQVLMANVRWLPVLVQPSEAGVRGGGGGGAWRRFALTAMSGGEAVSTALSCHGVPTYQRLQDGQQRRWVLEGCLALAAACPTPAPDWAEWLPHVRALAPKLRAAGHPKEAQAAEALAAQLVRWTRGAGARGAGRGGGGRALSPALASYLREWSPRLEAAAALLPPSPAAALQALGGCSNPACANLEGDSEAGLALRACAGCGGAASYCCRECQVAHWRAGHKEACGVRG
ncbi:hypothetical protein HYH03_012844 [Edaphochlamys debaryana]|uniref:MYND-type domain-containing protein n=1 Tax=Edaphochlamys debaryana TaxID=47281 RepID=A0A835XZM0_9CHLO|nr:hypothetical protein HYH03_012844 [Edaphochlamys debaryana]|eukprot:KAG2488524.1 hypothetical protein HYH03_012844 [Edaphochlamys debaryana]